jgi:hypothetical protein
MTAVLGVDAAWTAKNASGYALAEKIGGAWRLIAAAPNGEEFSRRCGFGGKGQGIAQALRCAKHVLNDRLPDLIAVDMPLSRQEITGRRASDLGVSKRFGAAKCATHSPSAERPGKVSGPFRIACEAKGYELIVVADPLPPLSLAEVYPHPALLRLMGARERVPYKVGKTKTYWPQASPEKRRAAVLDSLRNIVEALEAFIIGVKREVAPRLEGTKKRFCAAETRGRHDRRDCLRVDRRDDPRRRSRADRRRGFGDLDSAAARSRRSGGSGLMRVAPSLPAKRSSPFVACVAGCLRFARK